ncbi:ester cyclase [Streptosporangium sp. NPDC023825]|uniref:ester cyclase n=1 Tax=Streptosporangium sp. NPDC023825 TaxID=3154909 RepID=UPI0034475420
MPDARDVKDRLFDALNEHDIDKLMEFYTEDAVFVTPVGIAEGREQIFWYYQHLLTGFPDMHVTPWYKVHCSDPAVTEWTFMGTHMGPFLMPDGHVAEGTGRKIIFRGCGLCTIEDDKVVTHRDYYDQLELYNQLGFCLVTEPV